MRPRRPSFWARLAAAIAGVVLLAIAAIPTIGLASLITVNLRATTPPGSAVAGTTARPSAISSPSSSPGLSPAPSGGSPGPSGSPAASPSPSPAPVGPRSLNLGGKSTFVSQANDKWCASAAIQNVVNMIVAPDLTRAYQQAIEESAPSYTTAADSRNAGWGPRGMADAITTLSGTKYALRIADTRSAALQIAATAIAQTRRPAVLLAWRGAHAWVMTGYKASRDPLAGRAFTVSGAYILDPWYPRVSNIWGRSLAPGVWHDAADLTRNYLPWRRPEARYPGRDGKFLLIIPVTGSV